MAAPSKQKKICLASRQSIILRKPWKLWVAALLLLCLTKYVEGSKWWWQPNDGGGSKEYCLAPRISPVDSNILFVAGATEKAGPTAGSYDSQYVAKFDRSTGTMTSRLFDDWEKVRLDAVLGMCTDDNGDVYLVGEIPNNVGSSRWDINIWKAQTSDMTRVWHARSPADGAGYEALYDCAVDGTYVYGVGKLTSSNLGNGHVVIGGNNDFALARYNKNNGNIDKYYTFGGTDSDTGHAIMWDDPVTKAHLYATGFTTVSGDRDIFLIKVRVSDMTAVNQLTVTNPEADIGYGLAIDPSGDIIILGTTRGLFSTSATNSARTPVKADTAGDIVIVSVDPVSFTVKDTIQFGSSGGEDLPGRDFYVTNDVVMLGGRTEGDFDGDGAGVYDTTAGPTPKMNVFLATINRHDKTIIGTHQWTGNAGNGPDNGYARNHWNTFIEGVQVLPAESVFITVGYAPSMPPPVAAGFTYSDATNTNANPSHSDCIVFQSPMCDAGHYLTTLTTWTCDACPIGKYTPYSGGLQYCPDVPAGYFGNATGLVSPYPCPIGQYQDQTGQNTCKLCPVGHFSDQQAQSACKRCPAGTYASQVGSTTCSLCPRHQYQPAEGQSVCLECPYSSHTANVGTEVITDCYCMDGYYGDPLAEPSRRKECKTCPDNAECKDRAYYPVSDRGYWLEIGGDEDKVYKCSPEGSCEGDSKCADGYSGDSCSSCDDGFYRADGICKECLSSGTLYYIILGSVSVIVSVSAFVLILVIGVVVFLIHKTGSSRTLRVIREMRLLAQRGMRLVVLALKFIQMVVVVFTMSIPWPSVIVRFQEIVFSLNIFNVSNLMPAECLFGNSVAGSAVVYYAQYVLPVIAVAFLFVAVVIIQILRCCVKAKILATLGNGGARFGAMICTTIYVLLVTSALNAFVCYEKTDGEYFMVSEPATQCFVTSGRWAQLVPAGFFLLVVVGVGVPLSLFAILFSFRRKLDDPNIRSMFDFLYAKYQPEYYYWECVALALRFLFTLCLVFSAIGTKDQTLMMTIVAAISLIVNLKTQPFKQQLDDNLELCAMISLFAILLAASAAQGGGLHPYTLTIIVILVIGSTLFTAGYMIYVFFFHDVGRFIRVALCRWRRAQDTEAVQKDYTMEPTPDKESHPFVKTVSNDGSQSEEDYKPPSESVMLKPSAVLKEQTLPPHNGEFPDPKIGVKDEFESARRPRRSLHQGKPDGRNTSTQPRSPTLGPTNRTNTRVPGMRQGPRRTSSVGEKDEREQGQRTRPKPPAAQ